MITQEELKKLLSYNPETGVFTWRERDRKLFQCDRSWKTWNSRYSEKEAGGEMNNSSGKKYLSISIFKKPYLSHRLAWLYMSGSFPDNEIDHINGDGRDNRFKNLRDVTRSENLKNARLHSNNSSGVVGVCWNKNAKKWMSHIMVDYNSIHLGYFGDWFEAICTRKSAEVKYGFHPNHGSNRPL